MNVGRVIRPVVTTHPHLGKIDDENFQEINISPPKLSVTEKLLPKFRSVRNKLWISYVLSTILTIANFIKLIAIFVLPIIGIFVPPVAITILTVIGAIFSVAFLFNNLFYTIQRINKVSMMRAILADIESTEEPSEKRSKMLSLITTLREEKVSFTANIHSKSDAVIFRDIDSTIKSLYNACNDYKKRITARVIWMTCLMAISLFMSSLPIGMVANIVVDTITSILSMCSGKVFTHIIKNAQLRNFTAIGTNYGNEDKNKDIDDQSRIDEEKLLLLHEDVDAYMRMRDIEEQKKERRNKSKRK